MTPSVGGARKARVAVLLVVAGVGSATLLGYVLALPWLALGLPAASPVVLAVVVVLAVAADVLAARTGQPRPTAVSSQVPREWQSLFAPETVAVLFGARLGIGPLTLLPTWLWWAVVGLGLTLGPGASALAGVAFALTRSVVMLVLSEVGRRAMARRMATVRRAEPLVRGLVLGGAVLLAGGALVVAR